MRLAAGITLIASLVGGLTAPGAAGQTSVVSPRPDRVAVTLYRDPSRGSAQAMQLRWLNGFALISEVRTIRIPAGNVDIRFEGVAGNILPQSAIVSGLPDEVVEKNQDAFLLSPASLIEQSLGRRVHLRRTSAVTGMVREEEAVIRSGAQGAVILQTAAGFEALRCTGLNETIVHDGVPAGLSARPTLSVRTRSRAEIQSTVTLSYLASGFDWQAHYVASLAPAGDRLDLFAWLTLASSDETSFEQADAQAVAGQVNHEAVPRRGRWGGAIRLRCWPQGRTSDLPLDREEIVVTGSRIMGPPPPPPPPPPAPAMAAEAAMMAEQEALGDLKLYRIPQPVTVASNQQKQIAFLDRANIPVTIVYRQSLEPRGVASARRFLIARNEIGKGLGVPLPAGRLTLFAEGRERPILIGEGALDDRAVGEAVEVDLGPMPGVLVETVGQPDGEHLVTVTNDGPAPIRFEGRIPAQRVETKSRLARRNGYRLWVVTVPANGRRSLRFRPGS